MSQMTLFQPGWLRQEISSALKRTADQPYIPDDQRPSLRQFANDIEQSETLRAELGSQEAEPLSTPVEGHNASSIPPRLVD